MLEETAGFAGVVINAYRPQWDDFQVTSVAGSPQMREALLGATYDRAAWLAVVLDERFARRGAYFIREGAIDWSANGARCLPDLDGGSDPGAWRPGDELFAPCRDSAGHILAVVSLGEPVSGRRPSDADLDYLVAIGASAACALDHGQRAQEAARHRAALEELRALAQEDPLTGLPNRRAFMRDFESELERTRRHGRPLALVLCDVDDLKHINDTHGHPGGDRALCAVGRNLRDALRAGDTAFRIGGDEFAVLMPETTAEQATIGDGNDAETLIASADAALYATKRAPAEMA